MSASAAGAGEAAPGGAAGRADRAAGGTENARCGPGAPQRAQSSSAGAYPATVMARSRKASRTRPGSRAGTSCPPPTSARSAPTTSRNSRSDGSRSSAVSRSAVSSTAVPAV